MGDGHHHHDGHGHGHHHHHAPSADADRRLLLIALGLTLALVAGELVAGLLAGSLALLSDAAHNVTDAASLGLALVAARVALRPASRVFTFGFQRSEVLSAQVNGASLLVFGALIGLDALRRLGDPPEVDAGVVVAVGLAGGLVNAAAAWTLSRAERRSLNLDGAMQHLLADLWSSVAAVVAGLVVLGTGQDVADPLAALVVVALMLRSGVGLLRASGRVLMEGTPAGLDTEEVGRALCRTPGVLEVHDLHVWEISTGFPALSAHVLVGADDDCHEARRGLERVLHDRFGIDHTTLQVDHRAQEELLQLQARPDGPAPEPAPRSPAP